MYFGVHFSTSCSCFVLLFVLLVHIVKVQAAPSAVLSDLHSFSSTWEDDKGEAPWPNQVQLEQKDDPQPLRRNIWLETLAATATESVSYPTQALPITQSDSQYPPAPDSPYQMESAEQLLFEFVNIGPANLFWGELARSLPVYNISDQCRASLNQTLAALHLGQQWAFSLTSSTNLDTLLESTFVHLADFDRCMAVRAPASIASSDQPAAPAWQGQYCVIDMRPTARLLSTSTFASNTSLDLTNQPSLIQLRNSSLTVLQKLQLLFRFDELLHVKYGFCMPSTCSGQHVNELMQQVLTAWGWNEIGSVSCQTQQTVGQKLTTSSQTTYVALLVLCSFFGIVALASLVDLLVLSSGGCCFGLLRCMSLRRSCHHLFTPTSNPKQVYGLQVLHSFIILVAVASHSYLYYIWLDAYVIYDKIFYHLLNTKSFVAQPFVNLFDINTGLLFIVPACNACLKLYKSQNLSKLLCLKEVLGKIIRWFPLMAILVSMQLCLPLFFSGPLADFFLKRDADHCSNNYVWNLLFINNFVDYDRQCVLHSWTISTEIQLFVLLSILIIPFKRWPAIAKAFTLILICGSIGGILIICYVKFLPPQFIPMPLDLNLLKERAKLIHFPLYAHVFEYFLPVFVFDMIYTKNVAMVSTAFRRTFTFLLMIAFVVAQFYSFPFMTLEFYGTRLLNACIVITCKLLLPVFFSWAIFNYSRHSTEQVFDELWLRSLYDKLLRVQIVRRKSTNDNRRCDYMMISQTGFDKPNAPNIALPPVETRTAVTLPCDVDMSNAEISGSGITAIKYIFLVYSRLAYSLYLSHHFYLSLSLYQVRRPLGTTTFDVWARGIHDVFFMHIYAIVFYVLVESPVVSLTRHVYRTICERFESVIADLKFAL